MSNREKEGGGKRDQKISSKEQQKRVAVKSYKASTIATIM